MRSVPEISGFLLHLNHHDPKWIEEGWNRLSFDEETARQVMVAMRNVGLNMIVIDCADAVIYRSRPELKRAWSRPMETLERLTRFAENEGLEVVPKLNFSQSRYYRHNHWMYPHDENAGGRDIFESDEYFAIAFELIDELIEVCRPRRFFHVGMDEDHDRSHAQFAAAINRFRDGLNTRGSRAVIWRDARTDPRGRVFSEKQDAVEDLIAKDIVLTLWGYEGTNSTATLPRLRQKGFEVWGAPGEKPGNILAWKKALQENGASGMLLTKWIPCVPENAAALVDLIGTVGPLYAAAKPEIP